MQGWINGIREVGFHSLFKYDLKPLELIRTNLQGLLSSFEAAESIMLLYIDNDEIHRTLEEYKI